MKPALALALLLAVAGHSEAEDFPRLSRVADGVFAYEQIDPTKRGVTVNNLIVITTEGVLIADGQGTVANTTRLVADVAKLTAQPIRYVVIGSVHGDHRGGDAAFPEGVTFIKAPQRVTLGGRRIEIVALERAHTGSDLEVFLPDEKVMFMSEAFSNRIFPSMANAYPTEWIAALRRAEEMDLAAYVPAHGSMSLPAMLTSKDELRTYREALERVVAEGKRLHDAHVDPAAAVSQAHWDAIAAWTRTADNAPAAIKRVYMELDGELR